MPLDPGIFNLIGRGVKSVNDYDTDAQNLLGLRQQNELGGMRVQGARQDMADDQAFRSVAAGFDPEDPMSNYRKALAVSPKLASGYLKGALDNQKTKGEITKDTATTGHLNAQTGEIEWKRQLEQRQRHLAELEGVQDVPGAHAWLSEAVKSGELPFDKAAQVATHLSANPASLAEWKQRAKMGGLTLVQQMEQQGKEREFGEKQREFGVTSGEAARSHRANEGIAAGHLAVSRAGLDLQRQQANGVEYKQDADGNYIALPKKPGEGPITAAPVLDAQGKPIGAGAGGKMTEDQGKATGWLVQANTAYSNMQKVLKRNPSAATPGLGDAVAQVPGLGAAGNYLTGADRQQFNQATSSFGEAVLRAATGAGVNKDEALQKARELTPQFGDSDEVVAQKMAAFPIYIESLKVRAGPGAKKAAGIGPPPAGTAPSGWRVVR